MSLNKNESEFSKRFEYELGKLIQQSIGEVVSDSGPMKTCAIISAALAFHYINIQNVVYELGGQKEIWKESTKKMFGELVDDAPDLLEGDYGTH